MTESASSPSSARPTFARLITRLIVLLAAMVALLFIPAGRLDWWEAWRFILAYNAFLMLYLAWGLRNGPQLPDLERFLGLLAGWARLLFDEGVEAFSRFAALPALTPVHLCTPHPIGGR